MARYVAEAAILIGAPGFQEVTPEESFVGHMRSREGAYLKFVMNDIEAWSSVHSRGQNKAITRMEKLLDPTTACCAETIRSVVSTLDDTPSNQGQTKALHIVFAGHGHPEDGAWMLKDGRFSSNQFLEEVCRAYQGSTRLHLNVVLDSCFASRFLIGLIVECQTHPTLTPYDCIASSLPDEKSFELTSLEHGALSFTRHHQGNGHVDFKKLAKAVDDFDLREITKAVQGMAIPNPVTLLTRGQQHSVVLTSGHHLEVEGAGHIALSNQYGKLSMIGLYRALYQAKSAYGEEVSYDPE